MCRKKYRRLPILKFIDACPTAKGEKGQLFPKRKQLGGDKVSDATWDMEYNKADDIRVEIEKICTKHNLEVPAMDRYSRSWDLLPILKQLKKNLGFSVMCNNCGQESTPQTLKEFANGQVSASINFDDELILECKCGNKLSLCE